MEKLYWVSTAYATFGIVVKNSIILEAAPIAKWMIGKETSEIRSWLILRKAIVKECKL